MAISIKGYNDTQTSEIYTKKLAKVDIDGLDLSEEERKLLALMDAKDELISCEDVEPLTICEGKVDFSKGYYLHGIPIDATEDEIENRFQMGILSVEHFGILESALECVFCVSVTKTVDYVKNAEVKPRYLKDGSITMLDSLHYSVVPEVGLIIDKSITDNDPQKRQLNFYDFVRDKERYIEKMKLTKEEVELLEFIKKCSPKCETVVNGMFRDSYELFNWGAITGRIPSQFIVGVCINEILIQNKARFKTCTPEEAYAQALKTAINAAEKFNVPVVDSSAKIIFVPDTYQFENAEDVKGKNI